MATKYSIFLGVLLAAVCSVNGDRYRVLEVWRSAYCDMRSGLMSSVKIQNAFTFPSSRLKRSGIERSICFPDGNNSHNVRPIRLLRQAADPLTDEPTSGARRRQSAHSRVKTDDKETNNNKTLRQTIINIASAELGIREASGKNDGLRVEEYLRYTGLGKGYEWCAAFVSWVYGQAGFSAPRNPWSPALFPKAKTYWNQGKFVNLRIRDSVSKADVFGIYGTAVKRINHVGLVKDLSRDYLLTVEGNSNNRVESRRRHLRTIYVVADWVD